MAGFCTECGRPLLGSKFCGECGAPILGGQARPGASATASDWPCSGGGPGRSNFAPGETGVSRDSLSGFAPVWTFACERGVHTQPVVVDDRIFIGTPSGYGSQSDRPEAALMCIDSQLGKLVWRNAETGHYNSNSGDLAGAPTYASPWLLCQFDYGPLWALDAESGSAETAESLASCGQHNCEPLPTVSAGFLFHAEYGDVRVAPLQDLLDRDFLSRPQWWMQQTVLDTRGEVMGTIAADGGTACALTSRGAWIGPSSRLFAGAQCVGYPPEVVETFTDPESDDDPDLREWNDIECSGAASSLGFVLTRINVASYETSELVSSAVVCFDAEGLSVAWNVMSTTARYSGPALAYEMAFFGDSSGLLRALSLESGQEVWNVRLSEGGLESCTPLIVNRVAIVGDSHGALFALDVSTGDLIRTWDLGSAITCSPSVAGGRIYVPTRSGMTALALA